MRCPAACAARYLTALRKGYQLFLTERYTASSPYRYFLELDFPWELEPQAVEALGVALLPIIQACVQKVYHRNGLPRYVVSMRTPYKLHLNFPDVLTTEQLAFACRQQVLEEVQARRLGQGVQGAEALEFWERAVDCPHGSFRMLGSRKARWLAAGDPGSVRQRIYHPVRRQGGAWVEQPLGLGLLCACSIVPTEEQLAAFEQSPQYLDLIYQDLDANQQREEAKRARKREATARKLERRWERRPVKVELGVQVDGSVRVQLTTRKQELATHSVAPEPRPQPAAGQAPQVVPEAAAWATTPPEIETSTSSGGMS